MCSSADVLFLAISQYIKKLKKTLKKKGGCGCRVLKKHPTAMLWLLMLYNLSTRGHSGVTNNNNLMQAIRKCVNGYNGSYKFELLNISIFVELSGINTLQHANFANKLAHLPNKCICLSISIRVSDSTDDRLSHIHHLKGKDGAFSWFCLQFLKHLVKEWCGHPQCFATTWPTDKLGMQQWIKPVEPLNHSCSGKCGSHKTADVMETISHTPTKYKQ